MPDVVRAEPAKLIDIATAATSSLYLFIKRVSPRGGNFYTCKEEISRLSDIASSVLLTPVDIPFSSSTCITTLSPRFALFKFFLSFFFLFNSLHLLFRRSFLARVYRAARGRRRRSASFSSHSLARSLTRLGARSCITILFLPTSFFSVCFYFEFACEGVPRGDYYITENYTNRVLSYFVGLSFVSFFFLSFFFFLLFVLLFQE